GGLADTRRCRRPRGRRETKAAKELPHSRPDHAVAKAAVSIANACRVILFPAEVILQQALDNRQWRSVAHGERGIESERREGRSSHDEKRSQGLLLLQIR